jgi:hypothetical protein
MQFIVTKIVRESYAVEADSIAEATAVVKEGNGELLQFNESLDAQIRRSSEPVRNLPTPGVAEVPPPDIRKHRQQGKETKQNG